MQPWLTKEPPWVFWFKLSSNKWIKIDKENMIESQKAWNTLKQAEGVTLSSYPGFINLSKVSLKELSNEIQTLRSVQRVKANHQTS